MKIFSFKYFLFVIAVLAVAFLVYTFLSNLLYDMAESNGKNRAQVVLTQHQDFAVATGTIEARNDVTLAFEEGGAVRQVHYEAGDTVAAGSVIATLDAATLRAEADAQQSQLEREKVRLNSFVEGPEQNERVRVQANADVSEQILENEVRLALVTAQQTAVKIENMVHTELDSFFGGTLDDPLFVGDVSVLTKQRINRVRKGAEDIFNRWRAWSNIDTTNYQQVAVILRQFSKDLRVLYDGIVETYDFLLPIRSFQEQNQNTVLLLAKMRSVLLDATVSVTKHLNEMAVARAKYNLTLAQSDESLAGSTEADRLAQRAQVDAEQERLNRLELQLAKTQVRAPFSGIIGEVFVRVGEFVQPGTEAVRFVSQDGYDLSVNVTEVEIQNISPDQSMRAVVEATGERIDVRVRTVDATEKRINDVPVYTVVFDVEDSDVTLRSGMTVNVRIPVGVAVAVFAVPRSAVMKRDSEEYVIVERGGDRMTVPVSVGAHLEDGTVVVTGELTTDDVVILKDDLHEEK